MNNKTGLIYEHIKSIILKYLQIDIQNQIRSNRMHNQLLKKIENKTAVIGIIGLGYVGLPLALEYATKGFKTIGFDIDERKIPILNAGKSYIKHIKADKIKKTVGNKKFFATADFAR